MIRRTLERTLRSVARQYPIVTVTGPRQSGKTTLCRAAFPKKAYVSLEQLDQREYAQRDPRGFLAEHARGAILDEVQHVPDLLSYLQVEVDQRPAAGRFVLTGSQHFGLTQSVAQSLAGRTAMLTLLPPALDELRRFADPPAALLDVLWMGAYPRIHDQQIAPDRWLADYLTTYVQRDVRQVLNIGDLQAFTSFVRLCAGRTAQEVNLLGLGGDAGVSHNTARAWLSVLEASYLCFRLPSWQRNVRKQIVKSHKLHFFDSGLVCHLLGIHTPEQLRHHPQRGAIFESWAVSEIYKARVHRGRAPCLLHHRDAKGLEVDAVLDTGSQVVLCEMKSGATVDDSFFRPLDRLRAAIGDRAHGASISSCLIYGGEASQRRRPVQVVAWRDIAEQAWGDK